MNRFISLAKFEIFLCVAGLVILLILKIAVMDRSDRRQRVWQEYSVLGTLCERYGLYRKARTLQMAALSEARELGKDDARLAFSLIDLGHLNVELKNYDLASAQFDEAAGVLRNVVPKDKYGCDPRLLDGETVRLAIEKAKYLEIVEKPEDAKLAYLNGISIFDRKCANQVPLDLANLNRISKAFSAYCKLASPATSLAPARTLLDSLRWRSIAGALTEEMRNDMVTSFTSLVQSTTAPADLKQKLIAKLDSDLFSSNFSGPK